VGRKLTQASGKVANPYRLECHTVHNRLVHFGRREPRQTPDRGCLLHLVQLM
jgi:hypothetical protein